MSNSINISESKIVLGLILSLISGLILISSPAMASEDQYGAENITENKTYTLEETLNYAIEDEYKARAEYELIIEQMDGGRPFTNIIESEETHIAMLKPLFEAHDISLPEDNASEHVVLPESIDAALEIGVQAEIDNIAMYEQFLTQDLPEDVESAFQRLKAASQNHLEAFKRALEGGGNAAGAGRNDDSSNRGNVGGRGGRGQGGKNG
jgi:hypothetical protein